MAAHQRGPRSPTITPAGPPPRPPDPVAAIGHAAERRGFPLIQGHKIQLSRTAAGASRPAALQPGGGGGLGVVSEK